MDSDQAFLEAASNFAFAQLKEADDDLMNLRPLHRVLAAIYSAQGVMDNGGLRLFFENDWPGQPPYEVFVEAYRAIGAEPEADVLQEATGLFELPHPEREREQRLRRLADGLGERLETLEQGMTSDVWNLLTKYARGNEKHFSPND